MFRFIGALAVMALALLVTTSQADARSPAGTPEYAAESVAITKMQQYYPAYRAIDAQMRSNRLSIAIPTMNRAGRRVDFKCDVVKRARRDGTQYYEVGQPQFVQY